jgi:hypothetical protein
LVSFWFHSTKIVGGVSKRRLLTTPPEVFLGKKIKNMSEGYEVPWVEKYRPE